MEHRQKKSGPRGVIRNGHGGHAALIFETDWGWMGLSASPQGKISAVVLPQASRHRAERALTGTDPVPASASVTGAQQAVLARARAQLLEFLAGERRSLDLPADLSTGSPFQRQVWQAAMRIPYGRVRSYGWVAERVGGLGHARAVGLALGANPVPILVPCHRVVAHDGSLGGFSCGLRAKRQLLTLEGTLSQLKR